GPGLCASPSQDQSEDYLALFDSGEDARKKLSGLSKASPDRTTWNILDDQPRAFSLHSGSRSTGSVDSPTGPRKREPGIALAATFTANNRSNKGAVGNSVTTILHNNYSEKPLTPKSSNQRPSFKYVLKLTSSSLTKSQKNFSSTSSASNNQSPVSPVPSRRREVSEEEAERFIQQVNQAAVTIQRWYRRHAKRQHTNQVALKRILASKRKVSIRPHLLSSVVSLLLVTTSQLSRYLSSFPSFRSGRRGRTRTELQQKRAQRVAEAQRAAEVELESLRPTGVVGRKKPPKMSPTNNSPMSPTDVKAKNSGLYSSSSFICNHPGCEILQRSVSVEDQRRSKSTLNELLDTLKLLEGEPERLSAKCYSKEKYAWIDEDGDSNSLTTDNLERHGQLSHHPALPDGGALLSEAKLQSIMSFLDEMEKSEQERPRSVTSGSHREVSACPPSVTGSMMRIKLELEEKKRAVNMLQAALGQQRELTARHVKETEKELSRSFQLQKEQYEATIQRHLTFIDQLINDKKLLAERCEGVVGELKTVDQKYTKRIAQMQEQHDMEIKKLKELMSATEKIRREKWIDEKTKKIKEITVKGLEPEIQKLISKHKQELKKLRTLHEAELLQADDRVAQRYVRQCEELRLQLEREKEEQCHRERELAKQRWKQLQEEELALQQQRRRLYKEVADEKERLAQLAARQRAELEDLRRQLEENSSLAGRALREELDKSREEQERRHQVEVKALQERLDIEKQTWEENYKKKEEAWLLSRERQLKEELRRGRDKEIELAIWTLEEETSKDKEESDRAADNRVKRVREKYEAELQELERSERAAVEKQQALRRQQVEAEGELIRLQAALRQKEQQTEDTRDELVGERRSLAEVIRQEFADRLVTTEEENRRVKVEVSEVRARLRLEVERVTREKEEELAEKEETVSHLRKQHEAALKRADHLEALWEQQRKQLLEK
uniref:Centrosomal protein 131 n=1 Tax=Cyclopterus lumpus TaxID=8103 RepID=A0A8C2WXK0_CYCLU